MLVLKQWGALAMLALGVGLVQVSGSSSSPGKDDDDSGDGGDPGDGQDPLLGLAAVLMACCTSGFAGVYFEKVCVCVCVFVRMLRVYKYDIVVFLECQWHV